MATFIRPEVSKENKYWINKHRYYELKHFCLQYPNWKRAIDQIRNSGRTSFLEFTPTTNLPGDPTGHLAVMSLYYSSKINLIEEIAKETDPDLSDYILRGVTEGLSYAVIKSRLNIPCSKDMYYDRYRKFFWLLSQERD